MKQIQRPILFTIIFGLIAGMTFIPATLTLSSIVYWPKAFNITIWSFLVLYGCFLVGWGNTRLFPILFPLLLLFVVSISGISMPLFLLLTLGIFSWIRSGICQNDPLGARMLFAEIVTSFGGGALVAVFAPNSSSSWAIGIFLFFLVQSLYFLMTGNSDTEFKANIPLDPFENARKEAEKILMQRISW